jgi:hypothetical protein
MGQGSTSDLVIYRSGYSVSSGGTTDVAHQDGCGYIGRITLFLSGNANSTPSQPIGMSLAVDADVGGGTVEDITINDTTGAVKQSLLKLTSGSAYPRHYTLRRVKDSGTSNQIYDNGALGAVADAFITLEDIECNILQAATVTDDTLTYLQVRAHNVVNRNATTRPTVAGAGGVRRTINLGQWKGDASVRGFHRYTGVWRGNPLFEAGFYGTGGGVESDPPYGKEEWVGPVRFGLITLAAGATWDAPPSGLYSDKGGDYRARVWTNDNGSGSHVEFYCGANTTDLTELHGAGAGILLTDTGAATAAAVIEVYKDMANQALHIRNGTAGTVRVTVEINP